MKKTTRVQMWREQKRGEGKEAKEAGNEGKMEHKGKEGVAKIKLEGGRGDGGVRQKGDEGGGRGAG